MLKKDLQDFIVLLQEQALESANEYQEIENDNSALMKEISKLKEKLARTEKALGKVQYAISSFRAVFGVERLPVEHVRYLHEQREEIPEQPELTNEEKILNHIEGLCYMPEPDNNMKAMRYTERGVY